MFKSRNIYKKGWTNLCQFGLVHAVEVRVHGSVSYHLQDGTEGLTGCLPHLGGGVIQTLEREGGMREVNDKC